MREKLIYGLVIGLLICLSGALYLYDRNKDEVIIDTESSATVETEVPIDEPPMVVVYLTGAIAYPDIYEVPESSRLYELIDLAGGFTTEAVKDRLNLARFVFDGEMIHVPSKSDDGSTSPGDDGMSVPDKVSINHGSMDELMTLTGIGKAKAEAIIAHREAHGPFQRIEDIMQVDGIKDGMFEKIKDNIII